MQSGLATPDASSTSSPVALPLVPRKRGRRALYVPSDEEIAITKERDSLVRLLGQALDVQRHLVSQLEAFTDFQSEAHLRADEMTRAYHAAFEDLARTNNWICAAGCCPSPVESFLVRLDRCRHFVCMNYVNYALSKMRTSVRQSDDVIALVVQCPVCSGERQSFRVYPPAIPFQSQIQDIGVPDADLNLHAAFKRAVSECNDLKSEDARRLRQRCTSDPVPFPDPSDW